MGEYSSHRDQVAGIIPEAVSRRAELEDALLVAFQGHITYKKVAFISFGRMTVDELAQAFVKKPVVVKAVLTAVNVAGRAISRDLGVKMDTYAQKINIQRASILAGYIKPMLPNELAIPSLCELDQYCFIDKELRRIKGAWEKAVLDALNKFSTVEFGKRKFEAINNKGEKEDYELDCAYPQKGEQIEIGIDVKRVESPQDIHKRSDEIINKASKFKDQYPNGRFYSVLYFPFPAEHINLQNRLTDDNIDGIFFASECVSTIELQAQFILSREGILNVTGSKEETDSTDEDKEDR